MSIIKEGGHRLCMMTTNASKLQRCVRALPIQALIVRIFFRLVKFFRRREEVEQWNTSLTPKNKIKLRYRKDMECLHSRLRFSRSEWEVLSREGYIYTVTIKEGKPYCTCNLPQLQKLSCAHVIAACSKESGCANRSTYSLCTS